VTTEKIKHVTAIPKIQDNCWNQEIIKQY